MMNNLHKIIGVSTLILTTTLSSFSQVTTTTAATPTQAVQNLLGSGTTPSNLQYQGDPAQLATFTSVGTNLPISAGVIISTGTANSPQLNNNAATFLSTPLPGGVDDNPLMNAIAGVNTEDGAILQFDFVPVGDTMKFNYVFASEEYNEFVNGGVNDAFGFFLSGPNPLGGNYADFNVALIPGTATPVSINTVNNGDWGGCANGPCTNCQYFIDNLCGASTIAPDAFTVLLTAIAPVVPCSTYTIKLGIADGGDDVYDSWVFLQANSFSTGAVLIEPNYNFTSATNDTLIYEGCSDVTLTFTRDGVIGQADTVAVAISGSATNGVDYTSGGGQLPNEIIFAPGQTNIVLTLTPEDDALVEGNETVTLTITNVTACGDTVISDVTFVITDVQPMDIDAGPDFQVCAGVPITSIPVITGGVPPYYQPHWDYNTVGNIVGTQLVNFIPQEGIYIFSATNGCDVGETAYDTIMVDVITPQFTLALDADSLSCNGTDDGAVNLTITGPTPPFEYLWTPGNYTTEDISGLTPGVYTVTVTDNGGCVVEDSVEVFEPVNIPINLSDKFICSGVPTLLNPNPTAGVSYTWEPAQYIFDPNDASPQFIGENPGPAMDTIVVYVTGTMNNSCGADSFVVFLSPQPLVTLINPGFDTTALCPGDTLALSNSADNTGYPGINTQVWSTGFNGTPLVVTAPGVYWLELTNATGCKNRDSVYVRALSPPTVAIDSVFYICGAQEVALFGAVSDPLAALLWQPNGVTTDTLKVNTGGTYTLIATNDCGSDSASTQVIQIPTVNVDNMPNSFTPNGDGVNDSYDLDGLFYNVQSFHVQIFNRWGARVYKSDDPQINWSAKNMSDGVYFMSIVYTDCNNELKELARTITVFGGKK